MSGWEIMVPCQPLGGGAVERQGEPQSAQASQVGGLRGWERPSVRQQYLTVPSRNAGPLTCKASVLKIVSIFQSTLVEASVGFLRNLVTQNKVGSIANANFLDQNPLFLACNMPRSFWSKFHSIDSFSWKTKNTISRDLRKRLRK